MNRMQQILAGVLIAQIILAVFMFWPEPARQPGVALLGSLTADQIVSFSVADNSGNSVALERSGEAWVISGTDGFPAKTDTITPLLEELVQVKTGRTVASNPDSFDRLQVADEGFLRRLTLTDAQGQEHVLYIGSSVGVAATHVRLAGSNDVLLTDMVTSFDFGSQARNWIDVVYLTIPREQMTHMTLQNPNGTYEFTNLGSGGVDEWVMAGLADGEQFNPNNLVSMLTRLTNLQMSKPMGKQELPEYGLEAPVAVVTLDYTDEAGTQQQLILRIGALDPEDNNYVIHASTAEYIVKIPSFSMADFVERSKEVFLQTEDSEG
jgi:hypothetical protein